MCVNPTKNTKNTKKQTQNPANRHAVHTYNAYKMIWGWGGVGEQQTGTHAPPPAINSPKHTGSSRCRKILALFCLSRSKNKSHNTPGFTPWVGAGRRDSYQLLVTFDQLERALQPFWALLGAFIGYKHQTVLCSKVFQKFF